MSFPKDKLRGAMSLYVIPDREIGSPLSYEQQTKLVVENGATCVQLRDKPVKLEAYDGGMLYEEALKMLAVCRRHGALFIVNDRLDVAMAVGADGVHIGQSDLPLKAVRRLVSDDFIVGVSVRTKDEFDAALRDGADYMGFGAVFPTGSKDDAKVVGLDGLKDLARMAKDAGIPTVAIGGVNSGTLEDVMKCGVDGASVISGAVYSGESDAERAAKLVASKTAALSAAIISLKGVR